MAEEMSKKEIDDLYKRLAAKHNYPDSVYLPMMFKAATTPLQARLLLELPCPPEELAKRLGISQEEVERHERELFEKGLAFPTSKGYFTAKNMVQMHDSQSVTKYDEELGEDFFAAWNAFLHIETGQERVNLARERGHHLDPGTSMRVIPYWETIQHIPESERLPSAEDLRHILSEQEFIALVTCPCARITHHEKKCDHPIVRCLNFGRTARYNVGKGGGRQISLEEALEIVEQFHERGLLQGTGAMSAVDALVCNCCFCCCGLFRHYIGTDVPPAWGMTPSRYRPEVDPEKCLGCQLCVERCQTGAAKMKLYPGIKRWKAWVDPELCLGCGSCAYKCPSGARVMKLVHPPEQIPTGRASAAPDTELERHRQEEAARKQVT